MHVSNCPMAFQRGTNSSTLVLNQRSIFEEFDILWFLFCFVIIFLSQNPFCWCYGKGQRENGKVPRCQALVSSLRWETGLHSSHSLLDPAQRWAKWWEKQTEEGEQTEGGGPHLFKSCGTSLLPEEWTFESATIPCELVCPGTIYIPHSTAVWQRGPAKDAQKKSRAKRAEEVNYPTPEETLKAQLSSWKICQDSPEVTASQCWPRGPASPDMAFSGPPLMYPFLSSSSTSAYLTLNFNSELFL